MSGGSSSSTSTSTENNFTSIDQRVIADGGSAVFSNSGGINFEVGGNVGGDVGFVFAPTTTDHGAIAAARDIALGSLDTANQAIGAAASVSASASMAMQNTASNAMGNMMNMGVASTKFASDSMAQSLGFAGEVLQLQKDNQILIDHTQRGVEQAYKTANDMSSGQRVVVLAGLAVVALGAVVMMSRGGRRAAA